MNPLENKTDRDLIIEMHTVLLGANGNEGLCKKHEKLAADYYKFKRYVLMTASLLIGSGVIGAGVLELLK